jgi:polyhydroxyalkanoate synthesis regulator phasin
MEQFQIIKQMTQFNKTAFDNSYNAMTMFREQNEKMANSLLDQATWMPEEGKKALTEWMKSYKKGCEDFKKIVDQNYKNVENYFTDFSK